MDTLPIKEARLNLGAVDDGSLLCTSCYAVLNESEGEEGEPNKLMCPNAMCLDETTYNLEGGLLWT